MGVLKWVDWTVSEPRYFQLQTDHTPIHLALLDEVWPRHVADIHNGGCLSLKINPVATQICTCHQLLHPQVLHLLIKLFETEHSQLDVMEQVGFLSSSSSLSATRLPHAGLDLLSPVRWSWRRLCWTAWFTFWAVDTCCPLSATFANVWRSSTRISPSSDTLSQR